jgi:prepilin-type N-terminal cleavage/methylation domain-containing protein
MLAPRSQSVRAFTLVEVIVGSVILAIVASATTSAVTGLARTKSISTARQQSAERAHAAVTAIANDAMRLVRDHDLYFTRVVITDDARGGKPTDELLLIVRTIEPVRGVYGIAEGADFEVQYRLEEPESDAPSTSSVSSTSVTIDTDAEQPMALWKRVDPAMDEFQTAGGIATRMDAGIVSLSVEVYDGKEWKQEWDSDFNGLPHGLRIVVEAQDDKGVRTAVARRVVAIDRTPLPIDTTPPDEGGE